MTSKTEQRHKRTIAEELHAQWRNLERKGDSEAIAAVLDVSKPTIDKALIYGCVHQQKIVDGITKYFADRIIREKESATQLKELATDTATMETAINQVKEAGQALRTINKGLHDLNS